MKFAIITHAEHKIKGNSIYAYEPYVREMNLWLKYVDEVSIVAPVLHSNISKIESEYKHVNLVLKEVFSFNLLSFKSVVKAVFLIPSICFKIFKVMKWADHIHLRCPGNIGLLGSCVQLLFPDKPKTIKYAGNWDPKSKQPWSYRLQKWILSNTFLTRNAKVLVYGKWPNQTKNSISFFTASYSKKEFNSNKIPCHSVSDAESHVLERSDDMLKQDQKGRRENNQINILFVGALTKGKQPLLSVKVIHRLLNKGYPIKLFMYGEGVERSTIEAYIEENNLQASVILAGNSSQDKLKKAYQNAQFLLFISKSEGWPKVIAEAMFWGCLPISSHVSCIPYMLDNGNRGALVSSNEIEIIAAVESYIKDNKKYNSHVENAMKWSRKFTLEKFDDEIGKIIRSF